MNMVAGSRKAECYTLLIYWDFTTCQPSLGFTENGPKMWKYPVSSGCVEENSFFLDSIMLMLKVRVQNGQTGYKP